MKQSFDFRSGLGNPYSIGHDDLDPFGGVGVGGMSGRMVFDPLRSGSGRPRLPGHPGAGIPGNLPR